MTIVLTIGYLIIGFVAIYIWSITRAFIVFKKKGINTYLADLEASMQVCKNANKNGERWKYVFGMIIWPIRLIQSIISFIVDYDDL